MKNQSLSKDQLKKILEFSEKDKGQEESEEVKDLLSQQLAEEIRA